MKDNTKTIFILINRSFITRNILRSGTLELLKKKGYSVVVFFNARSVPEYIRKEFEDDSVKVEALKITMKSRLHRYVNRLKRYLVVSYNTKLNIRYLKGEQNEGKLASGIISRKSKASWKINVELGFLYFLHYLAPLRYFIRFSERVLFPQHDKRVKQFFKKYHPQLVFSTSAGGTFEYPFMKEAKRRGVTTMSMNKSWDNITNEFNPIIPDYFVAQNNITKKYAMTIQAIPEEHIFVTGIPQFDWYQKDGIKRGREEHFEKKGLDPERALIFFGSEGIWAPNDHRIAKKIYEWIHNNELEKPCQLLVREHYSQVRNPEFNFFRGKKHVRVDDYRTVDFLLDKWDPSVEETIDFVNSVTYCDVMISVASSLSLDAACVDRPAITIGFDSEYVDGKDVTSEKLYNTDHMYWLMTSEGVEKVDSYDELKHAINAYLRNPEIRAEGRKWIRDELCYKVDGKSSERLVAVVEKILTLKNSSL